MFVTFGKTSLTKIKETISSLLPQNFNLLMQLTTTFKPQPRIRNLLLLPQPKIKQTVFKFPFTTNTVCNKLIRALQMNKIFYADHLL